MTPDDIMMAAKRLTGREGAFFYAAPILRGAVPLVPEPGLGTMATDGAKIFFDPALDWFGEKVAFVLAHEMEHIWLQHPTRMRALPNHSKANIAADVEVNEGLCRGPLATWCPGDAIRNPRFAGRSMEWIYRQLPDQAKPGKPDLRAADPMMAQVTRHKIAQAVTEAFQEGRTAESWGGYTDRLMECFRVAAEGDGRDWASLLAPDEIGRQPDGTSFCRPDRRFVSRGLIVPGRVYQPAELASIVLYIDASGSMDTDALDRVREEVQKILAAGVAREVTVVAFNNMILKEETFAGHDEIEVPSRGSGGTEIHPVLAHLRRDQHKYSRAVVLSDMEFSRSFHPTGIDIPIIWAQYGTHAPVPTSWGKTLMLG